MHVGDAEMRICCMSSDDAQPKKARTYTTAKHFYEASLCLLNRLATTRAIRKVQNL